ncbi:MAG: ferritin [Candidatus Protochlamydia sp.]|nr:ferritin [Candidatus Protochlamydia sp.]
MNDKVYKALNEQIKHEFFSSYLYLSIASYFENIPLDGFGKWFRKQAAEEHEHAMKIYNYIIDRNLHVDLQAIEKPTVSFNSNEEVFALALEHEQKVTHWIHQIYDLALQEKDHATQVFLQWFITEQVEEEKNAQDNLDLIRLIGDDKSALLILDQNLGKRVD